MLTSILEFVLVWTQILNSPINNLIACSVQFVLKNAIYIIILWNCQKLWNLSWRTEILILIFFFLSNNATRSVKTDRLTRNSYIWPTLFRFFLILIDLCLLKQKLIEMKFYVSKQHNQFIPWNINDNHIKL